MYRVSGFAAVREVSDTPDRSGLDELQYNEDCSDNHCFTQCNRASSVDSLSTCSDNDIFNDILSPAFKKKKGVSSQDLEKHAVLLERDSHNDLLTAVDIPPIFIEDSDETIISRTVNSNTPINCTKLTVSKEQSNYHVYSQDVLDVIDCLTNHHQSKEHFQKKFAETSDLANENEDILAGKILWNTASVGSPAQVGQSTQRKVSECLTSVSKLTAPCKNLDPVLLVNDCTTTSIRKEKQALGRLAGRIKITLRENAKVNTPVRLNLNHVLSVTDFGKAEEANVRWCAVVSEPDSFYGLPLKVKQLLQEHRSISSLYPWQQECLSLRAVANCTNLIYSLPTSGGKTLVAEILIFRQLLCKKSDALLILPYVALVQEKVRGLSVFAADLDFLVEEYAASKGQFPPRARRKRKSLFIATIEKANSLINSLIEHNRMSNIGLVVVDELHMLGEGGGRGATLEMSLIKLMHASPRTQIVGMSATLNNISDLQTFLSAEIYTNSFRPVELHEFVKMNDAVYVIDTKALCAEDSMKFSRPVNFQCTREQANLDVDCLTGFIMEVVPQHSCLVFCPTKKNCENVAQLLCKFMSKDLMEVKKNERKSLLRALRQDGAGELCQVLRETIPYGVAYHHSGLTMDERKSIEEAYLDGTLCVLACTSTLAAGVNLPAKRVILRSPYVGKSFMSRSQYKQMIGRAGRAGLDSVGESILIISQRDKLRLMELIHGPYDTCHSSLLYDEGKGIRSLILTAVGLQLTPTEDAVVSFVGRSLCSIQSQVLNVDLARITQSSVQSLVDLGLVMRKRTCLASALINSSMLNEVRLEVTSLGRAVFKGSIDISWGKRLYEDLVQAQQSLVVANHLHLLYLSTPYDMVADIQPDWMIYLNQVSSLSVSELKVAGVLGISEGYLVKMAGGRTPRTAVDKFVINRFYLTLMLFELWKQRTIWQVAVEFRQTRGFVQQLLSSAASFASCISHFCRELEEFWAFQDLLSNFVKKLSYCCSMELIPLMEIPGVKLGRARQLCKAGLTSLQHIAFADPEYLVQSIELMPRRVARQIVSSAKVLLTEKAEALREEAEDLSIAPKLTDTPTKVAVT